MNLPLRLLYEATTERVVSVDGAWNAPGLNLSHWPGNRTPKELAHDLSTGIALNFARLPRARREELACGSVAVTNNHYDTDGACALFAVLRPELALAREKALLEAAEAGDLFRFPSAHAFAVDAIVHGVADRVRTPWPAVASIADERERHEAALHELVERLPAILDGATEPYADLWRAELEDVEADLADLHAAARDEIKHLELAVATASPGKRSSRAHATSVLFDPGRHALFGSTSADRVLAIGPTESGTTYRFVVGTLSWFDLVTRRTQPRPDLAAMAAKLNEVEGAHDGRELAWRAQSASTPSPELWFGTRDHPLFAEHCGALAPSRLEPSFVRRAVLDALRAAWTFPE